MARLFRTAIGRMYGSSDRAVFGRSDAQQSGQRGGRQTPRETFLWLYNSMCAGYRRSDPTDLYQPEFEADQRYEARRQRWLQGQIAFAEGKHSDALLLLPNPAEQTDERMRRREWLILARARARAGDYDGAREALGRAQSAPPSKNRAIPLEVAAVGALIAALAGQRELGVAAIRDSLDILHALQAEIRHHEKQGWPFPAEIDRRSLNAATIDLGVALAHIKDTRAAEILDFVTNPDELEEMRIRNEPLFRGIRTT
jgi:tetratricopeptide (TPR) repeat protein